MAPTRTSRSAPSPTSPTPADFENIIINGKTRLGDVAQVVFGPQNSASGLHSDGKSGIGIGIIRSAQSNTVQISDGVYKAVAAAQADAAQGRQHQGLERRLDLHLGRGGRSGALAGLAVVIVIAIIFLFLMDWRATLVPAISMPVALVGTDRGHLHRRLFAQHPDPARHCSRHRSRGRRFDRRARKHHATTQPWAPGRAPRPCSARRKCSSRSSPPADADGGVRADLVPARPDRPAVP